VRVPVFGAPYEASSPGCKTPGSGGTVCCGDSEYSLRRDGVQHAAFKIWASRTNGTALRDGSTPNNFRSGAAKLTVSSGHYTSSVVWPNYFEQKAGIPSDSSISGWIDLQMDSQASSFNDLIVDLLNNYVLLLPVGDPVAAGFVVPASTFPQAPEPLDAVSWAQCRTSNCGAPLGSCDPKQGPSPYPSYRNITAASILEQNWTNLGRGVPKTCQVLATGQQAFIKEDFSLGSVHAVQYVSCDYQGTALVSSVVLSRESIDAGNTSPPPRPPPSPFPPSPKPTISPAGTATSISPPPSSSTVVFKPPTQNAALGSSPPEAMPTSARQGPAVAFVASIPAYSPTTFDATAQGEYVKSIQKSIIGVTSTPQVRIRSLSPLETTMNSGTVARRMLRSQSPGGVDVDTVVEFDPTDTTAASSFLTTLRTEPSRVFPPAKYGSVSIPRAAELNCITSCGPNGDPAPRVSQTGSTSCTCECQAGWITALNQPFDTFEYCAVRLTEDTNSPWSSGAGGDGVGNSITEDTSSTFVSVIPNHLPALCVFSAWSSRHFLFLFLTCFDSFACALVLATSSA